jgi:hypothetical protein
VENLLLQKEKILNGVRHNVATEEGTGLTTTKARSEFVLIEKLHVLHNEKQGCSLVVSTAQRKIIFPLIFL